MVSDSTPPPAGRSPVDAPFSREAPAPLEDQGFGGGWIVLPYFLHAVAGVFSGRVLLLAALGLGMAEGGAFLVAGDSAALALPSIPRFADAGGLLASAWRTQVGFWQAFFMPIASGNVTPASVVAVGWRLAVWSLFGVAIARVAARHLTHRERPTAWAAGRRSLRHWFGQFAGPAVLAVVIAALVGVISLLGAVSHVRLLLVVTVPLVVLLAPVAAALAIGLIFGAPLMWVSQAVERPDPFDAVSCGFAYVYQRPLRLIAFVAQGLSVGVVAGALVLLFVRMTLAFAEVWLAGLAETSEVETAVAASSGAPGWFTLFAWAPLVFHAAWFWFAATAVYLLMRRDIDEKQPDEIYLEDEPVASSGVVEPGEGDA